MTNSFSDTVTQYRNDVSRVLEAFDWSSVEKLADTLIECWKNGQQVFFCGNGGSAANAIHMSNDFLYGISKQFGPGLKCHSLSANASVITCLANDEGYENIFSHQLAVMGNENDVLVVLSGSGNSANILKVLETAKEKNIRTFGILGYSGGKAKAMVETPIHFPIDDMEISEDLQMIVAHVVKRHLWNCKESVFSNSVKELKSA